MEQYIPKAALVAEIKRLIRANELYLSEPETDEIRFQKVGAYSVLNDLLHSIDTLEVKEVDLEKEIKRWKNEHGVYGMDDLDFIFAKHFYELGLKAQKSATREWNLQEK